MKQQTFTMNWPSSVIKLTEEQAKQFGIDITQDEIRGDLKTHGMWNIPVSFKAIAIKAKLEQPEGHFSKCFTEKTVYGIRTMTNIRQSGYELEGYVSINGKKHSCFTSSELFEVNGKLINVAVIHARSNKYPVS
jgi:hypothetical protein